jgi:hypothetical protein
MIQNPTPYPYVNNLLQMLYERVYAIFGEHIVGMYLDGSLASGDFDQASDIDFILVTDDEITPDQFTALQAMHAQIAELDPLWGIQLEGSYLPQYAIQRYDPAHSRYPNIERGPDERLKLADHNQTWDTHRFILREQGIALIGPPAHTLIDPVPPDQLRQAMQVILSSWAVKILEHPEQLNSRGYQSYVVLSLCRMLYTLERSAITSKPDAAKWAMETLEERWHPLIVGALEGRLNANGEAASEAIKGTLEFIRYTIDRARQYQIPESS